MGLMNAKWSNMPQNYHQTVYKSLVQSFGGNYIPGNSQAVGNIIYSLGNVGASYNDFPNDVQSALINGFVSYIDELSSQEFSNAIYGFGTLQTDFDSLPSIVIENIEQKFMKIIPLTQERDTSSIVYGIAKMNAKWSNLSPTIKWCILTALAKQGVRNIDLSPTFDPSDDNILISTIKNREFEYISMSGNLLSCCIYSLGVCGAVWTQLPSTFRNILISSLESCAIVDQTLSNIVYGFSLMKIDWYLSEESLRNVILNALSDPNAFGLMQSQHIGNTIWGLEKLGATWNDLPSDNLEMSLQRTLLKGMNMQELANTFYGLGGLDVSWKQLDCTTQSYLGSLFQSKMLQMSSQVIISCLYIISIAVFVADMRPAIIIV